MAKLSFFYGAMGAGKTTSALQAAYNYEKANKKVLVLKPSIDTKGDNKIVSRINITREIDYFLKPTDKVMDLLEEYKDKVDCIIIDEAQFLTKEQVEELLCITKNKNIPVLCYGLRNDFQTNLFEGSKRLFELADHISELASLCCRCGENLARQNLRIKNGKPTFHGEKILIGGDDEYLGVCSSCYLKAKYKSLKEEKEKREKKKITTRIRRK